MAHRPTDARRIKVHSWLHPPALIGMAVLTFHLTAWGWSQETTPPPAASRPAVGSQKASPPPTNNPPAPPPPASQVDLSVLLLAVVLGMNVLNVLIAWFLAHGLKKETKAVVGELTRAFRDWQGQLGKMEDRVNTLAFQVSEELEALSSLLRRRPRPPGPGRPPAASPDRIPSMKGPSLETPGQRRAGEERTTSSAAIPEGLPTAPPPLSELERLLQSGLPPAEFKTGLQRIADDEAASEQAAARVMLAWWVWLEEKREILQGLRDEDLRDKLRVWREALDYYLWTDPAEAILPAFTEASPPVGTLTPFLEHLRKAQKALRQFLSEQGIERIEAPVGSEFIPGVVERSTKPPEPTEDPALHGRVYRIEPGEGGYRAQGRVLMPSYARRYEMHP